MYGGNWSNQCGCGRNCGGSCGMGGMNGGMGGMNGGMNGGMGGMNGGMGGMNGGMGGGMGGMNGGVGPQQLPSHTFPNNYEQPIVSPTQEYVRTNIYNTYVPHIHPSHTTTVNKHMIHNQHYFPHTESVVNECFETNTMCGTPNHGWGCPRKRCR